VPLTLELFVMLTERPHQFLLELLKCAMKMICFVKFLWHTRSVDQENVGLMCDVIRHKIYADWKTGFYMAWVAGAKRGGEEELQEQGLKSSRHSL